MWRVWGSGLRWVSSEWMNCIERGARREYSPGSIQSSISWNTVDGTSPALPCPSLPLAPRAFAAEMNTPAPYSMAGWQRRWVRRARPCRRRCVCVGKSMRRVLEARQPVRATGAGRQLGWGWSQRSPSWHKRSSFRWGSKACKPRSGRACRTAMQCRLVFFSEPAPAGQFDTLFLPLAAAKPPQLLKRPTARGAARTQAYGS